MRLRAECLDSLCRRVLHQEYRVATKTHPTRHNELSIADTPLPKRAAEMSVMPVLKDSTQTCISNEKLVTRAHRESVGARDEQRVGVVEGHAVDGAKYWSDKFRAAILAEVRFARREHEDE
jgi:hypothetical protein